MRVGDSVETPSGDHDHKPLKTSPLKTSLVKWNSTKYNTGSLRPEGITE